MSGTFEPIVFLPGVLCDARLYAHQRGALGQHRSHVADLTRHDTVAEMAQDILDDAPERFALVGLSMGGYVALEIIARAPERVSRIALLSTSARADDADQIRTRKAIVGHAVTGKFRGVTPRLLPTIVHPQHADDPAVGGVVLDMAEDIGLEAFIRQQHAVMDRPDQRDILSGLSQPTLIVCGREDQRTPCFLSREMHEAIPGSRLEVLAQCGHLPPLEHPARVTQLLGDWLRA